MSQSDTNGLSAFFEDDSEDDDNSRGNLRIDYSSSSSPDSEEDQSNDGVIEGEKASSTQKGTNLHVSVDRAEILSTKVREGNNELEGLGVEVYDQQTYERGVFDQVDKAISSSNQKSKAGGTPTDPSDGSGSHSKASDLMQLIHDRGNDKEEDESNNDQSGKDEQVLQLTRLERLSKKIKIEPTDTYESNEDVQKLPKIPRKSSSLTAISDSKIVPRIKLEKSSSGYEVKTEKESQDDNYTSNNSRTLDSSDTSEYCPKNEASILCETDEDLEFETDSEDEETNFERKNPRKRKAAIVDDGDYNCYAARIKAFNKQKAQARMENILDDGTEFKRLDELVQVDDGLKIPREMWSNLFEHQKTGVRWLWELHQLGAGGILGDEMGLGKTIQMIAFLTALRNSNLCDSHKVFNGLGPTVLVCPATVMQQWLIEFRTWWPPFRVAILHSTGTFSGNRQHLVQTIHKARGILIVSYPGVVIYQDYLHALDWHYAILDEGHKIRNPDAQVTLACKRFRTPHRIILSGSPVQNNLRELWSIFDFIYPGKLGTLPVFMDQFATPITQGGYANASDIQVQIAYKCACVLRDTIKPFLLRRTKAEVNSKLKLPERSEQVLFCKLTELQRKMYQSYLEGPTVRDIKRGYCQIFVGLIELRKICNHPDLFDASQCKRQVRISTAAAAKNQPAEFFSEDETLGHYKKSGKMMVVDALLKLWKQQGHKVLLFTQSRQMLKIFSMYLKERDYNHLTMDGATPIGVRQALIEDFNKNQDIFLFLLTTRVGGVGINLIGADRIIIYDPDWNPSTDIQARERAWRIGQKRHVIIYRLITAGTIEEKIYHRQVFKLYLTNRILKDAKQKRFFKTNDLYELFRLGDDENIETKALFDDDLQIDHKKVLEDKMKRKASKTSKNRAKKFLSGQVDIREMLSDEKLNEMRKKAKLISQMISLQYSSSTSTAERSENQVKVKIEPGTSSMEPAFNLAKVKIEPGSSLNSTLISDVGMNPSSSGQSIPKSSSDSKIKREKVPKKRVDYLVRQDTYRPEGGDERDKSDPRYKRDDYILDRLFKNSNIFGALKHDKIESDQASDYKVVESEAERVARDAIRALRESRRMCLGSSSGIPNWTGRNGQMASRSSLYSRAGARGFRASVIAQPSSSSPGKKEDSLMDAIKKRNQNNPVDLARDTFHHALDDSDDEESERDLRGKAKESGSQDMASKIRDFLLFKSSRPGEAQTDEMLKFFKENFKPDKTAIFKAILYKMCEFQRRGSMGFWLIKSEFRN